MQTNSGWSESNYQQKSLGQRSSVWYDILSIVKKPEKCFELQKNDQNIKKRQAVSKHVDVLYSMRSNPNQYYQVN